MSTHDITDRLAAALADAAGLGDCRQVPHETRVDRWRALLAEHADRSTAEGWEREADRLDEAEATDKAKPGAASAAPGCKRNPSVATGVPTYTVELVAGWFRRWLGASTIRQRDRDYATEILSSLAAAGRLPAAHHLPLLRLTEQETEALILAARAYTHLSNGPTLAVLRSALAKLTTTEETA